jgi:recombinational DNA repair ATPase RecF
LALHHELAELGAQTWMTGADSALFREIESPATVIEVKSGTLTLPA